MKKNIAKIAKNATSKKFARNAKKAKNRRIQLGQKM